MALGRRHYTSRQLSRADGPLDCGLRVAARHRAARGGVARHGTARRARSGVAQGGAVWPPRVWKVGLARRRDPRDPDQITHEWSRAPSQITDGAHQTG